jgi:hypothetical protein
LKSERNEFSRFIGSGKHNGQHFAGLLGQKWAGKIDATRIDIVDSDRSECRELDIIPYDPIVVCFIMILDQAGVGESLGDFGE